MHAKFTVNASEIETAIQRIADTIANQYGKVENLIVAGIANGGVAFARRLADALRTRLGRDIPCGTLSVAFHRDDIRINPIPKKVVPTEIPAELNGATLILADDVLGSGRTVRAALGEIFGLGRPDRIVLAVLFDRNAQILPIRADISGFSQSVPSDRDVVVVLGDTPSSDDSIAIRANPSRS